MGAGWASGDGDISSCSLAVVRLYEGSSDLKVRVLGPLELLRSGEAVPLTSAKQRLLLAALVQRANLTLSIDAAIDAIWNDQPPASARGLVQNYVSQLRKACGLYHQLQTVHSGYRLVLGPDDLDATVFERLVGDARCQRMAGEAAKAVGLLGEALALWRGAALGELATEPSQHGHAQRLEELRLHATEERAEALLALGRHGEVIGELESLVTDHPLRERFCSQLMRGLYAEDRQAESLRAYQKFRQYLVTELGLEPSPALMNLEREIAFGSLTPSASPLVPESSRVVIDVRASLTFDSVTFGRDAELRNLRELLDAERLVSVVGPAGVGKTHLALRLVEGLDQRVTVVPLAPLADLKGAVAALVRSLDLRSTTGDLLDDCMRLLNIGEQALVLDNCEHILDIARDLVAALLAGCPHLRVLTTSRERLGLPVEHVFRLAPLSVPTIDGETDIAGVSSVSLFVERARRARPDFAPDARHLATIADIVRRLDGLPLAIELAAGRLAVLGVDDLAARLDQALDLLEGARPAGDARHRTLRAAVEWSYELLDEEERRLFRHLSVFPDGFDLMTAEGVAADLALTANPIRALGHLVDASMITVTSGDASRYRMLDTLRHFGLDCLVAAGEVAVAKARLAHWALDCVAWIFERLNSADEPLADRRLRSEVGNLHAAWRERVEAGDLDTSTEMVVQLYLGAQQRELIGITSLAGELLTLHEGTENPKRPLAYILSAHEAIDKRDFSRAQDLLNMRSVASAVDERTRSLRDHVQSTLCMFRGEFAECSGSYPASIIPW